MQQNLTISTVQSLIRWCSCKVFNGMVFRAITSLIFAVLGALDSSYPAATSILVGAFAAHACKYLEGLQVWRLLYISGTVEFPFLTGFHLWGGEEASPLTVQLPPLKIYVHHFFLYFNNHKKTLQKWTSITIHTFNLLGFMLGRGPLPSLCH